MVSVVAILIAANVVSLTLYRKKNTELQSLQSVSSLHEASKQVGGNDVNNKITLT